MTAYQKDNGRRVRLNKNSGTAAKKRSLNRKIIKFSFVMSVMLIFSSFFGLAKSYAGTESVLSGYKKVFVSAEIKQGHDIYDIAYENLPESISGEEELYINEYLAEVVRINHVYNLSELDAGNHIIVPSYR